MGLVDVYNVRLSSVLDNMQPVVNAFLALYGMQGTTQRDIEQVSAAKERAFTDRLRALLTVLTAGKRLLGEASRRACLSSRNAGRNAGRSELTLTS